jgi:hypothetical protein
MLPGVIWREKTNIQLTEEQESKQRIILVIGDFSRTFEKFLLCSYEVYFLNKDVFNWQKSGFCLPDRY